MTARRQVAAAAPVTIHLPPDVQRKLERLAQDRGRSGALLAADAVAAYVEHELAVADDIRRGLADVAAGRVTDHGAAMAQVDAVLDGMRRPA